jgi:hypothetical protein
MGLDLYCNGVSQKVGSYQSVQRIRYLLLVGMKYFVEMMFPDKKSEIDYLTSLLGNNENIRYEKYSVEKCAAFRCLGIAGFFPFIFHSDHDGFLTSYEAGSFVDAWDLAEDYMDEQHLKDYERKFYLHSVFQESIDSDKNISFC